MKGIAILGSTGSIGQSALAVVDAHPDGCASSALAAGGNAARLAEQVAVSRTVAMATPRRSASADSSGRRSVEPAAGRRLIAVATHPDADVVLFASSGTAALDAVLAAIEAGKTIALANKEILVMAGAVVMAAAQRARRRGAAGRQRAQRHPPVPARPAAARGAAADPDGLGRPVPRRCRARELATRDARPTRCSIRPGGWGRRSPSIRRR